MKLQPGKCYRLGINAPSFKGFKSATGVPVDPVTYWFVTADANGEPVPKLQPPRIVEISPTNGAQKVPASTVEMRVRFDRKMGEGFSWTDPEGKFPEVSGRATWNDDGTTCVVPVKLQPGHTYVLSLNSAWNSNFQSAQGVPLPATRYTFTTESK